MRIYKPVVLLMFSCISISGLRAQVPDSIKQYVTKCIDVMQKESLYSRKLNWKKIRKSVNDQLSVANTRPQSEAAVIWAFNQLKDDHGYYAGIDTFHRYKKPGPERVFSKGILAAYQKPRSVTIKMLDNGIAYYKMPAVLIGSNTDKMKQWANMLTDSICKLEAQQPRAYIIDLRMNNGGNSEPMWQALKNLVGQDNRTYMADARKKILPDETDSATLRYKAAANPDRPCTLRNNIPVAVLIGPGTASSGEIMALSFTTRSNTRLFGEPTIGVASVTNGFPVENKGFLLLTVGYITDAHKKVLKSYYIKPDVYVKAEDNFMEPEKDITVQTAVEWLKTVVK
jgi:C-terminal processing protease CtpA/Prc